MSFLRFSSLMLMASFAVSAHAQSLKLKPLGNTLERFNNQIRKEAEPGAQPTQIALPGNQPNRDELYACISSVCGPAKNNIGAFEVMYWKNEDLVPQQTWDKEFGPKVLPILEKRVEVEKMMADRFLKAKANGAVINPQHPLKAFAAYIYIYSKGAPVLAQVLKFTEDYKLQVNFELLQRLTSTWPEPEIKALSLLLKESYQPFYLEMIAEMMDPFSNPMTIRLKRLFPTAASLREAQIADATALLKTYEVIRKEFSTELSGLLLDEENIALLQKAKTGEDLNPLDSDDYMLTAKQLDMFSMIFQGEMHASLDQIQLDLPVLLEQAEKQILPAIRPTREMLQKSAKATAEYCTARLKQTMALSASDFRYNRLKAMTVDVKKAAKEAVRTLVLPEAAPLLDQTIDDIQFQLPESRDNSVLRLRQAFRRLENSSKRNDKAMSSSSKEVDQVALWFGVISAMNAKAEPQQDANARREANGDGSPENLDKDFEIVRVCSKFPIDSVSDAAATAQGKIAVSWFTANYPTLGIGIVAHEMGHVLSFGLRILAMNGYGKYIPGFMDSLSCVANRNPFQTTVAKPNGNFSADTKWTEEDWADYFSSKVLNLMESQQSKWMINNRNKGCALVMDAGDLYYEYLTGLVASQGDTHSPGILRMLMVANDRNKMTPQCSKILKLDAFQEKKLTCE